MIPRRIRICPQCRSEHQHRRRYCSDECKRTSMAAQRIVFEGTCRKCAAPFTREVPVAGRRPELCKWCQQESHRASLRDSRRRAATQEAEEFAAFEASPNPRELEDGRLRLACQLEALRAKVHRLAADLGLRAA